MPGRWSSGSVMAALCSSLLMASITAQAGEMKDYQSDDTARLHLPFSDAAIMGDILYLSGQLGNRPGTPKLVAGGIEAQTHQAMQNIGAVLEANGSSFGKIIKCTIMLADIADWLAFNNVYVSYFDPPYPARSAFATNGLALDALVEIDCIAHR